MILDTHLFELEKNDPCDIIKNMIAVAKLTQPIENIDSLVPLYLKDE